MSCCGAARAVALSNNARAVLSASFSCWVYNHKFADWSYRIIRMYLFSIEPSFMSSSMSSWSNWTRSSGRLPCSIRQKAQRTLLSSIIE